MAPRCHEVGAGSAASRITIYRNSPIARARLQPRLPYLFSLAHSHQSTSSVTG
jgi:hypothetical protein